MLKEIKKNAYFSELIDRITGIGDNELGDEEGLSI